MILARHGGPHLLMGKPFPGNIFGNALGDISIPLDLSPTSIEFIVVGHPNPILYERP
jgi:hypothetical protein